MSITRSTSQVEANTQRVLRPRARPAALVALIVASIVSPVAFAGAAKTHVTKVDVQLLDDAAATKVGAPHVKSGVTEVTLNLTASPTYSARLEGRRLLIDITDADVDASVPAITSKTGLVGGVLSQTSATESGSLTRVSIALNADAQFRLHADGNILRVWLTALDETGAKPATAVKPQVMDVKFAHTADADTVTITLSTNAKYSASAPSTGKSRLELSDTILPDDLERTLDVSAFKGVVTSVSTYHKDGVVILEADRSASTSADAKVDTKSDGTSVMTWTFSRLGDDGKPLVHLKPGIGADGGAVRTTKSLGHDAATIETTEDSESSGFLSSVPMQAAGKYTGRKIDLDFKDADIHNILRLLADVGKVNIVTADDVSGSVTIKMKNVPWDQALDVVLQAKALGMVRTGNLIRVARAAELEHEREMLIARHKQELELAPLETRLIPVSYATAGIVSSKAADLKSPRGTITVDERTNVIIVRDVTGSLDQIEALVHSLDTQTPEVLIEARIVEATSTYLRDVGIQWGGDVTFSPSTGNPTGLAFPNSVGVTGGASDTNTPTQGLSPTSSSVPNPNFAINLPAAVGAGAGGALGFTLGSIGNILNLNLRLSAAESNGMLRIVSSPRILTLDNREASISQGTLIPFAQIGAQGVQTTFQEAKLGLSVKPHVTADGSVSMHVKINRDEPDFNQTSARGDPTILRRQAETDLLVQDGNTVVIGGIYTRNTGKNVTQVPFFGSIPIIGVLFQHRKASDTRGELVIFLTPRIINRSEALGR
ncbi:MAG: type IV pilus secretin PilQ [Polyangiales bacterium]